MKLLKEYPWLTEHNIKKMFISLGSDINIIDTLTISEEEDEILFSFKCNNNETCFSFTNSQFKNMLIEYRKIKLEKLKNKNTT